MRIGVVFGGQSVEHEVSVITAAQAMAALPQPHTAVPLYIAKSGRWYSGDHLRSLDSFKDVSAAIAAATCVTPLLDGHDPGRLAVQSERRGLFGRGQDELRIDYLLPLVHGSHGEDGTLAALSELWGIPYAGCGPAAGAVSMDKVLAKQLFRAAGLPVLADSVVHRDQWQRDAAAVVANLQRDIGFPMFVKPATLGSSIGVAPAADEAELRNACDVALFYDSRLIVEPQQRDIIEVNCGVLGRGAKARTGVLEQPLTSGALTYADKYSGGAKSKTAAQQGMKNAQRLIPAPLPDAVAARVRDVALAAFAAVGACGVVRVDFLVAGEEVILNEINTVPGSLAFYLFEPDGLAFPQLLSEVIDLGLEAHTERAANTYSIDSWLLSAQPAGAKVAPSRPH